MTQFRDLIIGDGKGNQIALFDGSEQTLDIVEITTTSPMYPWVSDNGTFKAKSDGVNDRTCIAGSSVVITVEYGIVTGITGSSC